MLIWRAIPLALVLLAGSQALADPPALWDLPHLMAAMREVKSATATFTERKFDQMLKQPLQSSGKLVFIAPDRLEKDTLTPAPSRLVVVGDHLTIAQPDGKTRELSLSDQPAVGALVESIRATLAGDWVALDRYYALSLQGDAHDWSLSLDPRDERLRSMVTSIRIHGVGNQVLGIDTQEHDGDRTEMTIVPKSK